VPEIDIKSSGDRFRALTEHCAGDTVEVEYYWDDGNHSAPVTLR
jgi:hypothetical protein